MELKPGHNVSLLSKKTGLSVELEVKNRDIVVRTQDIEAILTLTSEGLHLETNREVLIGRYEEDE